MRKLSFVVLASVVLASCQDATTAPALNARQDLSQFQVGSYIVVLKPGMSALAPVARSMVGGAGATIDYTYSSALNGYAARMTAAAAASLAARPEVAFVEPDQVLSVNGGGIQSPATWGLDRLDQAALPLNNSYTYTSTGAGVSVYIIDTGIRASHAEFGGRATAAFSSQVGGAADCNGHGTHVAGTIGGSTYGVAKQVTLYGVRVLDCTGNGRTSEVVAGIDWVTANARKPAVANMSLGGGISMALDAAVQTSIASGVTYAIAAGNSNVDACNESPARTPQAITVGATGSNDFRAYFSNFGACVDIFAPGINITSAWYTGDAATNTISGTSMATPHVAGVAALYLETHPTDTPAAVASALTTAARSGIVQDVQGSPNLLLAITNAPPVNAAPVAKFTSSCTLLVCTMNGTSSTDDKGVVSYAWSMPGAVVTVATGSTATATYLTAGTKTISLTVTDAGGLTNTTSSTVTVLAPVNQLPSVAISAPTNGRSVVQGVSLAFTGSATDPEDGALSGTSLTWTSSINGAIGSGPAFSTSSLSVGTHTITLTAKDSQGAASSASVTLIVTAPVNQLPTASIVSPAVGVSVVQGTSVTFSGTGTDPEDGTLAGGSLVWTSSIDGAIGTGATFAKSNLSAGTHTISLKVTDSNAASVTATRLITVTALPVNAAPVAAFTADCAGQTHANQCTFDASASSDDNGIVTYVWNWGNGKSPESKTVDVAKNTYPAAGTYTVTLTVTDAGGLSTSISKAVTVGTPVPVNTAPTAAISSPNSGLSVVFGTNITFSGAGIDPQDGALSGASLTWTSSVDGAIGTGVSFSKSNLSIGTHTITLRASDPQGLFSVATTVVTVTAPINQPPTASIIAPASGTSVQVGTAVTFSGSGVDPEQGTLSGASLVWSSNLAGNIGTGASFTTSALAVGTHTITLTVSDAQGLSSTAQRVISVTPPPNRAPTALIATPISSASVIQGTTLLFSGSASDPEDGSLTGASLTWSSSISGIIGTGVSFPLSTLSVGTHLITLTARDAQGLTGTDTHTIVVSAPLPPPPPSNKAPVAAFTVTCSALHCTADASASSDDNGVVSYAWAWGNGKNKTVTNTTTTTTYYTSGNYVVTLTVTDAAGLTNTLSKTITLP